MYETRRTSHNWLGMQLVNVRVREHLPSLHGRVLDLGCGKRPFERDILAHATDYTGVDWGMTLHGLQADVVADLNGPLPLPANVYDHVVSFEVLEHLAEPSVMLAEAFRVLKPGGSLVLSVPFQWRIHEAPWDYFRYTRHGLEHLLGKAGFTDIVIQPSSGFWVALVLKCNYQTLRLVKGSSFRRGLMRALLVPFWYAGQKLAPVLDRLMPDERETIGYFVRARKP